MISEKEIRELRAIAKCKNDHAERLLTWLVCKRQEKREFRHELDMFRVTVKMGRGGTRKLWAVKAGKNFCTHENIDRTQNEDGKFSVTHLPSGLKAGTFATVEIAKWFVEELETSDIDWSKERPLEECVGSEVEAYEQVRAFASKVKRAISGRVGFVPLTTLVPLTKCVPKRKRGRRIRIGKYRRKELFGA